MLICALQLWAIFNAFTSLWKVSCSDLKHCRNHIFSCQVLFLCVAIVGVWSPALVPLSHYLFFLLMLCCWSNVSLLLPFLVPSDDWEGNVGMFVAQQRGSCDGCFTVGFGNRGFVFAPVSNMSNRFSHGHCEEQFTPCDPAILLTGNRAVLVRWGSGARR